MTHMIRLAPTVSNFQGNVSELLEENNSKGGNVINVFWSIKRKAELNKPHSRN